MDSETKDKTERDLRILGERFVTQFNMLVDRLEHATSSEELLAFQTLPTIERLESIEAFARTLTRDFPWVYAPPQDRAYMAEIRCVVSDAVWYAQQLDYAEAAECVQTAMRKLIHVRDRARTGRYRVISPELAEAIEGASNVMMEVIQLFMEAEKSMVVDDDDSSAAR